jgi:hypothetical protein
LTAAIGLSRLIHPTFIGFAYAARVGYESDGVKQIFPAQIKGISSDAFLSPNRKRDWLTDSEANRLHTLVSILRQIRRDKCERCFAVFRQLDGELRLINYLMRGRN